MVGIGIRFCTEPDPSDRVNEGNSMTYCSPIREIRHFLGGVLPERALIPIPQKTGEATIPRGVHASGVFGARDAAKACTRSGAALRTSRGASLPVFFNFPLRGSVCHTGDTKALRLPQSTLGASWFLATFHRPHPAPRASKRPILQNAQVYTYTPGYIRNPRDAPRPTAGAKRPA